MFKTMHNDPRSAAMGGIGAVFYGNPLTVKFNAASGGFINGAAFDCSSLTPDEGDILSQRFGASVNMGKYGSLSFISNMYKMHYYNDCVDEPGKKNSFIPTFYNYLFNYSIMAMEGLAIGLNVNYLLDEKQSYTQDAFLFDFGALKKFIIEEDENYQNLYIGAGFSNITNIEHTTRERIVLHPDKAIVNVLYKNVYPSELRVGVLFDMETKQKYFGLNMFKFAIAAEYLDMVNSSWYSTFKFGLEFTFLEMLSLRVGFYNERNGESFSAIKNTGNSFGAGLNIPIDKITKNRLPISLKFDYANLTASYYETNSKRYQVFNAGMNYIF